MKSFIDKYYKYIRPLRPLYGWALDSYHTARTSKRAEEWKARNFEGAKLDICGGRYPYNPDEYLNVDIVDFPQVDLAFDITKKFPIPDNVIEDILSVATLEHLRKHHNEHVLKEFHRILKPGGRVRISTPNIEAIADGIKNGEDLTYINQHLFGRFKESDTEDYDLHRWMYTTGALIETLHSFGYRDAKQVPMDLGNHDPKYNFLVEAFKA